MAPTAASHNTFDVVEMLGDIVSKLTKLSSALTIVDASVHDRSIDHAPMHTVAPAPTTNSELTAGSTSDKASNKASDEAFGITELLEAIIYELPMQDIFVVQRVSKVWKATIEGSEKIQRAIFKAPVGLISNLSSTIVSYNKFIVINPVFLPGPLPNPHPRPKFDPPIRRTIPQGMNHYKKDVKQVRAWNRHDASHRSMLISQPAVKGIYLRLDFYKKVQFDAPKEMKFNKGFYWREDRDHSDPVAFSISNPTGVTVGDVFEALKNGQPGALDRKIVGKVDSGMVLKVAESSWEVEAQKEKKKKD